jgi:peptidoglycan/xylan/chitin deacetylase (PgdA/CDA1 family)
MLSGIQKILRTTDATVASAYLSVFRERDALIAFLFHSLFADEKQIELNHVDPLQRTTVAQFRNLIEYYLGHGYRFVAPEDLLAGLPAQGKFAALTFDDGYFNNTLALPVLEELRVPATFFISTEHVRLGKCFWWDVLHRERVARGATEREIYRESQALKVLPTERIEEQLKRLFGEGAFEPRGDVDRPMTAGELKDFAKHPRVRIGNHTANHAILTNYPPAEAREQVGRAQAWLAETLGAAPVAVAYPNGDHDEAVLRGCAQVGLRVGFTVRPEKVGLPVGGEGGGEVGAEARRIMRLGRFTPHAETALEGQCRAYRSDLQLYGSFRAGYLKLKGRRTR